MSSKRSGRPRVPGNPAAAYTRPAYPPRSAVTTAPSPTVPPLPEPAPQDVLRMLSQRLEALIQQNVAGVKGLQASGITFPAEQVINGRIDSLMEALADAFGPQGPLWLLQARLRFEEALARNIAVAQEKGRTAVIAHGGSFTAGAIRDLARATGTYGG